MNATAHTRIFQHPEPKRRKEIIYPVFLPFSGCATRCVFCAQPLQTGRASLGPDAFTPSISALPDEQGRNATVRRASGAIRHILHDVGSALEARHAKGLPPPQLGFYGGTFTAQPEAAMTCCLDAAAQWLKQGLTSGARCSTRPDAINKTVLKRLGEAGFFCLELGVQSFDDAALGLAGRGYGREVALEACVMAQEAGFELGVQLMPGMPGVNRDTASADVNCAAMLRPDFVRLYPCLVLEDTVLAQWWRQGRFYPWTLEETADFLADACLVFWRAGVRVARMGLVEEPAMAAGGVLAGPRHPGLGDMAKARALFKIVAAELAAFGWAEMLTLEVPRRYQGQIYGTGRELCAAYAGLGLAGDAVHFTDGDVFALRAGALQP